MEEEQTLSDAVRECILAELGSRGKKALEAVDGSWVSHSPADRLSREQTLAIIDAEVSALPARQREAFLLRYWEEMDVAEAAKVMGCSEGSVKTHCSRATHALAVMLKKQGIEL